MPHMLTICNDMPWYFVTSLRVLFRENQFHRYIFNDCRA